MKENGYEYQQLFQELSEYEKSGVRIKMDGASASPMQVVSAHLVKEENSYMRDYIVDENGSLEEICFHNVSQK